MRFKPVFLILIILCFVPGSVFALNANDILSDKFEEIEGTGLEINTNPAQVDIYIDGVYRGLSPAGFHDLAPGEHRITLNKEGYKEKQFNVVLFNNSKLAASVKMEEILGYASVSVYRADGSPEGLPLNTNISITSQADAGKPDAGGSEVSVSDGSAVLICLPAGYRTIRVSAFGWEDASATVLIVEDYTTDVEIYMKPAEFKLKNGSQSRKRFNPKNSGELGVIKYRFEVSAPGGGTITILDKEGSAVYQKQLDHFDTWFQSVTWDGSANMPTDILSTDILSADSSGNPAPEGVYTVLIEAYPDNASEEAAEIVSLKMETEIDYSINIFPLSLAAGVSGLAFAPMPFVLPPGSFQIEGGILLGSFSLHGDKAFSSLPFEIGVRVSPFNRLEVTSAFHVNPHFKNKTGWGVTGSVKYNFLHGGAIPLELAAAVSYSWASGNAGKRLGESALSPGRGIGFYAPLSLEVKDFSLVLSPGVFWRGPDGSIPALLLCAGALYRGGWFNAGVSLRPEFDFGENGRGLTRILAGIEGRFYPPPSNIFFTVQTGVWNTPNLRTGAYGGLGIGIIY